ncbi:glycosyltransferase [Neobacillus sp. K501]
MKISLAMIVKNAESTIKKCLDSVKDIVDEMVVVDTGSTDNTVNIINQFPSVKLYHYHWCDDFSAARNFSIEKTSGDYILVIDDDEFVVKGTRKDFEEAMKKNAIGRIQQYSHFIKQNQDFYSNIFISRLFPRNLRYTGTIHEQIDGNNQRMDLDFVVYHVGYLETNKGERNIPLLEKELEKNPNDSYYLFQLGQELRIQKQYEKAFHFLKQSYKMVNPKAGYYEKLVIELIDCGKELIHEDVLVIINDNENKLQYVTDFHFLKGLFYLDFCLKNPKNAEKYIHLIESSFQKCLILGKGQHTEFLQGTSSYLACYNLGVFNEVTGNRERAIHFYQLAANFGYKNADNRLEEITN